MANQVIINVPDFDPYVNFSNALWIKIRPIKMMSQSTGNRGGMLTYDANDPEQPATYRFLAPPTIADNISHQWEPYDSIQKRAAEKVIALTKTIQDAKALVKGAGSAFRAAKSGAGLSTVVHSAVGGAGEGIPQYKLDSPLVYQNSSRREYTFTFQLVAFGQKNTANLISMPDSDADINPQDEIDKSKRIYEQVTNIVKEFQKMSAPTGDSFMSIGLPYIFQVTSEGAGSTDSSGEKLINVQHAACTGVQTIYKEPYINGYPIHCDLTLTFKDISPLMRETIRDGSIIKTAEHSKTKRKENKTTKKGSNITIK